MTTEVIKSIKPAGGGDYTTIEAWAADRVGILPSGSVEFTRAGYVMGGQTKNNSGTLPAANLPVKPTSFSATYTLDFNTFYTATDDGAGNITGTHIALGTINYATGEWVINFDSTPSDGSIYGAIWIYTINGRDTIEIAEIYGGGNSSQTGGGLTISADLLDQTAWITSATNYIEIRAAAGEEHSGVWNENKARISMVTSEAVRLFSSNAAQLHIKLTNLQIESAEYTTDSIGIRVSADYVGLTIDRCIIRSNATYQNIVSAERYGLKLATADGLIIIKNSIIMAISPNNSIVEGTMYVRAVESLLSGGLLKIYNCNLIAITSGNNGTGTISAYAINSNNAFTTTENCYLAHLGAAEEQGCYGGTISKGAKDATNNAEATSPALRNIGYTLKNFVRITPRSENLHPILDTTLIGAGADLSASGVLKDIEGIDWGAAYNIGAFKTGMVAPPDDAFFTFASIIY